MLQLAVNLVGKYIDVVASCEIEDATENIQGHEQTGGIVRRVDVNRPGVGADERFERGEIVRPAGFGFATPFANRGAGAFGNGKCTFVAGRFDNRVIAGSEKRLIEEEDGFFGGGDNDQLIRMNLFVDRGEDFAEPGRSGRLRVAAPVFQEGVVGAGFEGQKFLDGLRFCVGGRKQILDGEFVLAHVFFNAEGSDLHEGECAKGRGPASRTNLTAAMS